MEDADEVAHSSAGIADTWDRMMVREARLLVHGDSENPCEEEAHKDRNNLQAGPEDDRGCRWDYGGEKDEARTTGVGGAPFLPVHGRGRRCRPFRVSGSNAFTTLLA